jgi:hypothetical protein
MADLLQEIGLNLAGRAGRAAGSGMSEFAQLAREKSLVRNVPEHRRNSSDISKGIIGNDISRFESWRPSQPVRSLWAMSELQK